MIETVEMRTSKVRGHTHWRTSKVATEVNQMESILDLKIYDDLLTLN